MNDQIPNDEPPHIQLRSAFVIMVQSLVISNCAANQSPPVSG
jgi:hypothetical protein